MTTLRVLTLNILNLAERWPERLPLLLADFAALQPDVAGLQEVVYVMQQDRLLAASGAARYDIRRGWAGRPEYGNAIVVRDGTGELRADVVGDRVDIGLGRSAHAVEMAIDGRRIRVLNTHFHHLADDDAVRDQQARQLLEWVGGRDAVDATVMTGDYNAVPGSAAHDRIRAAGFRSAFAEATGAEPERTFPSGLVGPMVEESPPVCLDYIWLSGAVRCVSARIAFDRPAADDPTLYPSDHLGVVAELELG